MAITLTEHEINTIISEAGVSSSEKRALNKLAAELVRLINLELENIQDSVGETDDTVDSLVLWATALANKLNADSGVADEDYDNDPLS